MKKYCGCNQSVKKDISIFICLYIHMVLKSIKNKYLKQNSVKIILIYYRSQIFSLTSVHISEILSLVHVEKHICAILLLAAPLSCLMLPLLKNFCTHPLNNNLKNHQQVSASQPLKMARAHYSEAKPVRSTGLKQPAQMKCPDGLCFEAWDCSNDVTSLMWFWMLLFSINM